MNPMNSMNTSTAGDEQQESVAATQIIQGVVFEPPQAVATVVPDEPDAANKAEEAMRRLRQEEMGYRAKHAAEMRKPLVRLSGTELDEHLRLRARVAAAPNNEQAKQDLAAFESKHNLSR